ncbi:MAG TPA: response regulator transcription factor [Thermoanaerobaculia bacterium]
MSLRVPLILFVDDDARLRSLVAAELRSNRYEAIVASNGREALERFRDVTPDIIVTDLAMPESDGFDLIEQVRRESQLPIIVLSVRNSDTEKIRALDLGADDYVVKPFSMPELLARLRAQLRRRPAEAHSILRFPGLVVDIERRRVILDDREIRLTPTELALLELLVSNAGKPVTLAQIVRRVWKGAPGTSFDTVRVHIRSLRRKIEPNAATPRYIATEPWVGYRFIAEPEEE